MAWKYIFPSPGFTLLEVAVTILVFTIGILGTLALTTGVLRGNFFSKNITSATAIAQSTIEGVQRAGYSGVEAYISDSTQVPASVSLGGVDFSQTASAISGSPSAGLKKISVVVSWHEANNTLRTVNVETILAEQ